MTPAVFVTCPDCHRLMLGQITGTVPRAYPQPHECQGGDS